MPTFVAARAVSIQGDQIVGVVLPLAVLATSGSATTAGLVAAAVQVPQVLAALHLGALVDRQERRALMLGADALRAMAYVGIGLEIALGGTRLVPLLVLGLVIGVGDAVFSAAAGSYLPNIAASQDLMRANGLVEASDAGATLTGPAIGGWLMQRFSPLVAFVVNAASFVVSALLLFSLPTNRAAWSPDSERTSVTAGVRLLMRDRQQQALLSGAVYMHLLAASAFLAIIARSQDELHLRPGTIGLMVSAAGIGGLVSSLLIARYVDTDRWTTVLTVALGVNALGVASTSVFDQPWLLAGTIVVLDGASALAFIVVAATRQRITVDAVRGRLLAASTACTALVRMLAVAVVGVLIDTLGASLVLVTLGVLAAPFLVTLLLLGHGTALGPLSGPSRTDSPNTTGG